jgi:hypothetical protein
VPGSGGESLEDKSIVERESGLHKALSNGQIVMINLGGAIGTTLFLSSGIALGYTGPCCKIAWPSSSSGVSFDESTVSDDSYSAKETEQRREAAIKKMLATPPKPYMAKGKKKPSPNKRKDKKIARTLYPSKKEVDHVRVLDCVLVSRNLSINSILGHSTNSNLTPAEHHRLSGLDTQRR